MGTAIPVFDEIKEREICGNPADKKINFYWKVTIYTV